MIPKIREQPKIRDLFASIEIYKHTNTNEIFI